MDPLILKSVAIGRDRRSGSNNGKRRTPEALSKNTDFFILGDRLRPKECSPACLLVKIGSSLDIALVGGPHILRGECKGCGELQRFLGTEMSHREGPCKRWRQCI